MNNMKPKAEGLIVEHEADGPLVDIEPELQQFRSLSDMELARIRRLQETGGEFVSLIMGLGNSRELTLARTRAEEAIMWSIKAITK